MIYKIQLIKKSYTISKNPKPGKKTNTKIFTILSGTLTQKLKHDQSSVVNDTNPLHHHMHVHTASFRCARFTQQYATNTKRQPFGIT